MKIRSWMWSGCAAAFAAGVVAVLVVLSRRVDGLVKGQREIDATLAELRADVEAANTELLVLRAELDLRQDQLRRLIEEGDGENRWRSMN